MVKGLVQRANQQLVWLVQMSVYSRYHPTRELYSPGRLEKAIAFCVLNIGTVRGSKIVDAAALALSARYGDVVARDIGYGSCTAIAHGQFEFALKNFKYSIYSGLPEGPESP